MKVRITILILLLPLVLGCADENGQPEKTPKLLLVSFDGFRYDYLEFTDTPNFDAFVRGGVMAESMRPVFPTKTFPNHYSIVTGLYPENTGLIANNMYDPQTGEEFHLYDREAVEDPGWYGGEPIWNTVEQQGLKAGTMFWVGSEAPIQGQQPTYWKRYDGEMSEEARIDTVVSWLAGDTGESVDFATLYFELVDDAGHDHGIESDSIIAAIQRADRLIGYLDRRLEESNVGPINIMIVSDHGMAELYGDKLIVLDQIINPGDIEWITFQPVTFIQPTKGKTDEIYRQLKEREEHYRIYRRQDLPEKYHLKNHRRVTDLVMIADIPYTILTTDFIDRFRNHLPTATHGYDNFAPEMQAFFAANGPDFVSGDTVGNFQSIHLYGLMNMLLGTEPAENDGSIDSVRVLLK
ncbi:MAG: ectonucleotide pyrophosphatase/phosphodiesterase [Balneolaceae bacterium]|nr:ectonucleotide pyrophosphatase/phosphodiesterase [Balneolaceae bacterium]